MVPRAAKVEVTYLEMVKAVISFLLLADYDYYMHYLNIKRILRKVHLAPELHLC